VSRLVNWFAFRTYLRDLIEATHLFLKMLERYCAKHSHLVVQRKKKKMRARSRPKKKDKQTGTLLSSCASLLTSNDIAVGFCCVVWLFVAAEDIHCTVVRCGLLQFTVACNVIAVLTGSGEVLHAM